MNAPIRWYNHLAAWAWDVVGDAWMELCIPAWIEAAEAEAEEMYAEEERARTRRHVPP